MSQTTPPNVDPLPPAPSTSSPSTFASLADAFLAALINFQMQLVALALNVYNNAVDCYNNAVAAAASAVSALASANAASASAANAATSVVSAGAAAGATPWTAGSYSAGACKYSPTDFRTYRCKNNGAGATDPALDSANWALLTGNSVHGYSGVINAFDYSTFMNTSGSIALPDLTSAPGTLGLCALSNSATVPATLTTSDGWSVATGFTAGVLKVISPLITGTPHGWWGNLAMTPPQKASTALGASTLTLLGSVALASNLHVYLFSDASGTYAMALDPTTGLCGAPLTLSASQITRAAIYATSSTTFMVVALNTVLLAVIGTVNTSTLAVSTGTTYTPPQNPDQAPVQLTTTTFLVHLGNIVASDLVVWSVSGTAISPGTAATLGVPTGSSLSVCLAPISATAVLATYGSTTSAPSSATAKVISIAGTAITVNAGATTSPANFQASNVVNAYTLHTINQGASYALAGSDSSNGANSNFFGISVSGTSVSFGAVQSLAGFASNSNSGNGYFRQTYIYRATGQAQARSLPVSSSAVAIVQNGGGQMCVFSISGNTLSAGAMFTTGTPQALLTDVATGALNYVAGSTSYSKFSVTGNTVNTAYTVAAAPTAIFSDTLTDKTVNYGGSWYNWTGLPTCSFPIAVDKFGSLSSANLKTYGAFT